MSVTASPATTGLQAPEAGEAWVVSAGYVDLFAVLAADSPPQGSVPQGSVPQGALRGRRYHILRAEAGGVLLGLPAMPGVHLLAVGSRDSEVSSLPVSSLLDPARPDLVAALDAWCGLLGQGSEEDTPSGWLAAPGESRQLQPGDTLQGDPAHVLWIATRPGDLATSLGEAATTLLALSPRGWIRAEREAGIRIMRLAEAVARDADALPAALDAFHAAALARLVAAIGDAQARLGARVGRQHEADAGAMAAALRRLASGAAAPDGLPASSEDACLAACRLAGAACRVTLVTLAPPHLPRPVATAEGPAQIIERVEQIAGEGHLRCRRVLLSPGWWRQDRGVLIAAADSEQGQTAHVFVLLPGQSGYRRIDPRSGEERRVGATDAAGLWIEALQIYPVLPDQPAGLALLFGLGLRGAGSDGAVFAAMALFTGLLALAPPLVAGLLFDSIIPHGEAGRVAEVAGALAVLAVAAACFELAKAVALVRIEGRLARFAQSALVERLLRLPVRFFAAYGSGDLANRLLGIETIRRGLTSTTVIALLSGLMSLFSLGLMLLLDARLAVLCTAVLALAVVATVALGVAALRAERAGLLERGRQDGLIVQLVIGMAKLRVAAAEQRAMRVWLAGLAREQASAARVLRLRGWLQTLAAVLPLALLGTLFAGMTLPGGANEGGAMGGAAPRLPLGTFMAFTAALGNLMAAALSAAGQLTTALRAIPLYERARPLLRMAPEGRGRGGRVGALRGEIELSDVSFRYDARGPAILDRLSLRIAAGEYVAIVGPSGSGKSTLMRLLLGFETPRSGAILFDGTAAEQFDPAALRRCMGVVLQQSKLSPDNLFMNIVGNSGRSLDDAWAAARMAGLAEDIAAMPMGMHTTVLEGGQGLSGGQRQRLLIARALVTRPRILLFDEATSALDNRTQDVVSTTLAALPATRVVIAHRLSTIAHADRVLVLDRGRLVQSGTYAGLLGAPGLFATLARRQLL
jgi:NHLM bacteriocin system ABC transporter ATP-binding protein